MEVESARRDPQPCHMVVEAADPQTGVYAARTYLLSHGADVGDLLEEIGAEDEVCERIRPSPGASWLVVELREKHRLDEQHQFCGKARLLPMSPGPVSDA